MSSFISSFKHRRWPRAALMAMVAILAIEGATWLARRPLMRVLQRVGVARKERMLDPRHTHEALIVGDSRLYSVDPVAIGQALGGLRASNCAWPFMGYEAYDLMLRAALNADKPPPRVMVTALPYEPLVSPPRQYEPTAQAMTRTRLFRLVPASTLGAWIIEQGRWTLLWQWARAAAVPPTGAYREQIRKRLWALVSAGRRHAYTPDELRILHQARHDGHFLLDPDRRAAPEDLARLLEMSGPFALRPDPPGVAAFERFLRRAREHEIPVVLLRAPISRSVSERLARVGAIEAYRRLLTRWREEYPNLLVPERGPLVVDDAQTIDYAHVNRQGDAVFRQDYLRIARRFAEQPTLARRAQTPVIASSR